MKIIRTAAKALLGIGVTAAIVLAAPTVASANDVEPQAKLSHSQAKAKLDGAGIPVSSSGGCSDRNNPTCTSLEQVNSATIDGAITLKGASGCALTVTGGTETGHADGTYSHWNGYKLDFSMTSCLTNYIKTNFTSIGGGKWQSGSGNVYFDESNHWDVTFHNCGGCRSNGRG